MYTHKACGSICYFVINRLRVYRIWIEGLSFAEAYLPELNHLKYESSDYDSAGSGPVYNSRSRLVPRPDSGRSLPGLKYEKTEDGCCNPNLTWSSIWFSPQCPVSMKFTRIRFLVASSIINSFSSGSLLPGGEGGAKKDFSIYLPSYEKPTWTCGHFDL